MSEDRVRTTPAAVPHVRGVTVRAAELRVGDLIALRGRDEAGYRYALVARVTRAEQRVLVVVHDLQELRHAATSFELGYRITVAARDLIRRDDEPGPWSAAGWRRAVRRARDAHVRSSS